MSVLYIDTKGNIRERNGDALVIHALPKTTKALYNDFEATAKETLIQNKRIVAFESYEVVCIRMYNYAGEWMISTNYVIDAFRSFWGSTRSFGHIFQEIVEQLAGAREHAFEQFKKSLDTSLSYFFLIPLNGEQRLGNKRDCKKPILWLGAVQREAELIIDLYEDPVHELTNVWTLVPKVVFEQAEQIDMYIRDAYQKDKGIAPVTGLCIYRKEDHTIWRVVHPDYLYLHNLRANQPDVSLRYVQLLKRAQNRDAIAFYVQHKDALELFKDDIILRLHRLYMNRYVKKEFVMLPQNIHSVLKRYHSVYVSEKVHHASGENMRAIRITVQKAYMILIRDFPSRFIINVFKTLKHLPEELIGH